VTSPRKVEANRRNALKSTGPRTAAGKARCSRNNLRHGVLSAAPIVHGLERPEEWRAHLAGVRASLSPEGYLEEVLTDRAALLLWRMNRVARYEVETLSAAVEAAGEDLRESEPGKWAGTSPARSAERAEEAARVTETLAFLETAAHEEQLDSEDAGAVLAFLEARVSPEADPVSIPGVPEDEDERWSFNGWTVGLLWGALEAYGRPDGRTAEAVRESIATDAEEEAATVRREVAAYQVALERKKKGRLLLAPKLMDTVLRYETAAERAFLRTLHELQRLQAAREGGSVPLPLALDVNVSGAAGDGMEL